MSTSADKLTEFQRAWMDADKNYQADLVAAGTNAALAHQIESNWWIDQTNWSRAAIAVLEATSPTIETAYRQAKAANDAVVTARQNAHQIVSVIDTATQAAAALSGLLKTVAT